MLVAVQPLVLEGAFASILTLVGLDDVVQFASASEHERNQVFDAAIVSAGFPATIRALGVVTLPDTQVEVDGSGTHHRGLLTTGGSGQTVDIHDQHDVIDLLDRHVPAAMSRKARLARFLTTQAG